jgi:hypothetical protein
MNYAAFTNDSLTMMYEAIRVRWRPTTPSSVRARKPGSAFARQPSGNGTPANWSRKCSNAECFSTSSTGRRIRRRYRLTSEPLGAGGCLGRWQLRKGYTPTDTQAAAVAMPSTAPMNVAVSILDRVHMWITPRFAGITHIIKGFIKAARLWTISGGDRSGDMPDVRR